MQSRLGGRLGGVGGLWLLGLGLVVVAVQLQAPSHKVELASPEVDAIERNALNAVNPKEQQQTPPDRWADPDPWVLDADDYATDFRARPGQLSEFFSERPRRFAHTDTWDAGSWEWPYVPDGEDARGMRSGYDWEGAGSSVSARGLDMPPDHDAFGELGPFPALSGQDELFAGVRSWDQVMPAGALPGSQAMGIPMEPFRSAQSLAQRSQTQMLRMQSLAPNQWTDYTKGGDGVKCVCDSSAAGDEEMEGLDPNVKPACTCTGGRTTQFSKTEEGGPLDTGAHGAWPQDLPGVNGGGDGAAYVDGIVGNNAYKARPQALAALEEEPSAAADEASMAALRAWDTLRALAERAVRKGETRRQISLEEEQEGAEDPETGGGGDKDEDAEDEDEGDKEDEGEDEGDKEADKDSDEEAKEEGRWRLLHGDPKATPTDRNIIEQIRRNYRSFLAESAYCDEMGDYCEGRLCRCKRRTGRHLCYKMNLLWQQDCKVASKVQPCEDPSVTEVKDMCSVMEKLPGVNVDNWLLSPKAERGAPVPEAPTFFFAPEGVYE